MDEYISREEVVKEIKSRIFAADDAWESGYNTAMEGIMEWIKSIPAADVQPVKHGRWEVRTQKDSTTIGQHNVTYCSECGYVLFAKEKRK